MRSKSRQREEVLPEFLLADIYETKTSCHNCGISYDKGAVHDCFASIIKMLVKT